MLALAAAGAAAVAAPREAWRGARIPAVVVLAALAVLGAVSAAWSVGVADDSLRWGLVTAGWAALAVTGAVVAGRERTTGRAAALLVVLACALALVGLAAAALASEPLAHREAGRWRAASTFQYAPGLALLCVYALPGVLAGMCSPRRALSVAAGAAGAVLAAAIVLAESRTQLAFALVVCAAAVALPARTVRAPRASVIAAVALLAAVGLGAWAVVGGFVPRKPPPDTTGRVLELAGVIVLGAAVWAAVGARAARGGRAALLVAAALLAAGVAAGAAKPTVRVQSPGLVRQRLAGRPAPPLPDRRAGQRLLHGRPELWRAAIRAFRKRPLRGGGADSFWFATRDYQHRSLSFFAHDTPLELAAELGTPGLLLSLALYAAVGLTLWRRRRHPALWLLAPPVAAFMAANLVDWPWHFAGLGAVFAFALGALSAPTEPSPR